jgi:hypothetical protein
MDNLAIGSAPVWSFLCLLRWSHCFACSFETGSDSFRFKASTATAERRKEKIDALTKT